MPAAQDPGSIPTRSHRRAVRKPPPRSIFGPIGDNTAPIRKAQQQAHRRTQHAQRRVERKVVVPYIPKLAHPTSAQRGAAQQIMARGLHRAGITTPSQIKALPKAQRQRVERAIGYSRTARRNVQIATTLANAQGIDLSGYSQGQLAEIGRRIYAANRSQLLPAPAHQRANLGLATIDLTNLTGGVERRLAGNPLAAFMKGTSALGNVAATHLGIPGRAVNDVVQGTVQAIPAAYGVGRDLVTHGPGRAFSDVANPFVQFATHPGRSFNEHPLWFLQALHGGIRGVSRGVGGAARVAGAETASPGIRSAIGATTRAPHNVDGATFLRNYSKDPLIKAGQVLADHVAANRHGHGPEVQVYGRTLRTVNAPARVADAVRGRGPENRTRRFADLVASRANSVERVNRETELRFARDIAPTRQHGGGRIGQRIGEAIDRSLPTQPFHERIGRIIQSIPGGKRLYRPERDIVLMVNEGVLRTGDKRLFQHDLVKERDRIATLLQEDKVARREGEPDRVFGNPDERKAATQRLATVERVLSDPKARENVQGVLKTARAYAQRMREIEGEASRLGVFDAERGARAMVQPSQMAHGTLGVGEPIGSPTRAIREFQKAGGDPSTLAFVPHQLKLRGGAAMHRPFAPGSRSNFEGNEARTGALFAAGASPHDYTHLVETLVGKSNMLANIHEVDRALQSIGIRRHDGKYLTAREAEYIKAHRGRDEQGNFYPGYQRLVPLRAASSRAHDLEKAMANQEPMRRLSESEGQALAHFNERSNMTDQGARNVVLVPAEFVDQLKKHMTIARNHAATGQMLTAGFRRTVLPFSTKWVFGNTFEAALRSVLASVSPHDPFIARKVLRAAVEQDARALHGPAAEPWIQASRKSLGNRIPGTGARAFRQNAERRLEAMAPNARGLKAETEGGLLMGNRGLTVHRSANETIFGPRGQQVANLPVVHEVKQGLVGLTDHIFAANRAIEREFERGVIGKFARERMRQMTGSWLKAVRAQRQAVEDVAKGLLDTPAQHQLANYIDETLGQYSRFSPQARNFIQTLAPFAPWYANAVRFIYVTMPLHRPTASALLALAEANFQKDYEASHKDLPPGELKTAIPAKGGYADVARFTPWGFPGPVMGGDLSAIASPLLPQVQGIQQAMNMKDPFGRDLQVKDAKTGKNRPLTSAEQLLYILNQAGEELLPGLSLARRLREGGRTAEPTSTFLSPKTKPGTAHGRSAVDRTLNPLVPIYLKPKKGSGNFDFSTAKGPQFSQGFDFSTAH